MRPIIQRNKIGALTGAHSVALRNVATLSDSMSHTHTHSTKHSTAHSQIRRSTERVKDWHVCVRAVVGMMRPRKPPRCVYEIEIDCAVAQTCILYDEMML